MADDVELLQRYASDKSEEAFAELVRVHLGRVYQAALRRLNGDVHGAEDVAQVVFADLARQAARLSRLPSLSGWLHARTRHAVLHHLRTERRRMAREQEAQTMHESHGSEINWERLRPVIDEALDGLGPVDRDAVLLRFFEGQPFAEVGARLNLSEDGARLRVNRALDKLHALLARRGVTSTVAALGAALAAQPALGAPTPLAQTVVEAALSGKAGSPSVGLVDFLRNLGVAKAVALLAGVVLLGGLLWSAGFGTAGVPPLDAGSYQLLGKVAGAPPTPIGTLTLANPGPRYRIGLPGLYETYAGDIGPELVASLDLDDRERLELKRLYLEMQASLRALLGKPKEVKFVPARIKIEYQLNVEGLHSLEEMFKQSIRNALDSRSLGAFASMDQDQVVSAALMRYGSDKWLYQRSSMDQLLLSAERWFEANLRGRGPPTFTVEIDWHGTGSDTVYDVVLSYFDPLGSGGKTTTRRELPGAILQRFFGDVVRQHRPEIVNEVSAKESPPPASPHP